MHYVSKHEYKDVIEIVAYFVHLLPYILTKLVVTRSYLLMNIPEEGENKLTDAKLQGYAAVLSIGSTRCKANILGMWKHNCIFTFTNFPYTHYFNLNIFKWNFTGHSIMQNLPSAVQTICETWNSIHTNEFPNIGSWVRE